MNEDYIVVGVAVFMVLLLFAYDKYESRKSYYDDLPEITKLKYEINQLKEDIMDSRKYSYNSRKENARLQEQNEYWFRKALGYKADNKDIFFMGDFKQDSGTYFLKGGVIFEDTKQRAKEMAEEHNEMLINLTELAYGYKGKD